MENKENKRLFTLKRGLVIALAVIATGLIFYFDLNQYFTFEKLANNHEALKQWRDDNGLLAPLGYIFIYALSVAVSLPGAVFITITGGLLFGLIWGTLYTVIGATLGATIVFILAKTLFRKPFEQKISQGRIQKFKAGFEQGAVSYLLILRLIPLFPFWLVNIVPAFFNVSLLTYIATTFFGIIPGSLVYTSIGLGVEELIDEGKRPDLSVIFDLSVLGPLIGLALLSSLPLIYKKFKSNSHGM